MVKSKIISSSKKSTCRDKSEISAEKIQKILQHQNKNHTLSQPAIFAGFKGLRPEKRIKVEHFLMRDEVFSPIGIAWRDDAAGNGTKFDHVTLQNITQMPTQIINASENQLSNLGHSLNQISYALKYGEENSRFTGKKIPKLCEEISLDLGLIIIPGVSVKEYNTPAYLERKQKELALINYAKTRGMPLLAICGGSWVLAEGYGGKLVCVKDHAYRGGMPRLSMYKAKVTHNKEVHRIAIETNGYILKGAMKVQDTQKEFPAVNSVHGLAVDARNFPKSLQISAISQADCELAPINVHSPDKQKMQPEQCIEAFETKHGVPVLGVQWHPEAYKDAEATPSHNKIIIWMAKAGQAYKAKQQVNHELLNQQYNLRPTNLLKKGRVILRYNHFEFNNFHVPAENALRHEKEFQQEIAAKYAFLQEKYGNKKLNQMPPTKGVHSFFSPFTVEESKLSKPLQQLRAVQNNKPKVIDFLPLVK